MEKDTIDRLTVLGLAIFVILSAIYLCRDAISKMLTDLAENPPQSNISLPGIAIPRLSLDWWNNMDPASRLIFVFIMTVLASTIIGGTFMYVMRKKSAARK